MKTGKLIVLAVVLGVLDLAAAGVNFVPVINDKPVVNVERKCCDPCVILAQQEMNRLLSAGCGRSPVRIVTLTLALAGDNSSPKADQAMKLAGLTEEKLGTEGFLLYGFGKKDFILCAYSGKGVLNGVYKILEKTLELACPRPQAGLDFAPRKLTVKPLPTPYSETPAFKIRGFSLAASQWWHDNPNMNLWFVRNLVNSPGASAASLEAVAGDHLKYGFIKYASGHAFHYWLPAAVYAKSHPEYYALIDGKPTTKFYKGAQIALGHPDVIDIIARRMIAYKKKYPLIEALPFGYNDSDRDGFGFGDDPWSVKLDSPKDFPKPGSKRPRTYSTRYFKAANMIIEKVNKVYPDLKLMVYAYHWPMIQPPDCEINKNIVIAFAPLYKCCIHPVNDPNCPRNALFAEHLKNWAKVTKNVIIREYLVTGEYPLFPLETVRKDMQFYRSLGFLGCTPETGPDGPNGANLPDGSDDLPRWLKTDSYYENRWNGHALLHFAYARLCWNPDESIEHIVHLFCRNYYGDASGPAMEKYHLECARRFFAAGHPGEKNPKPLNGDHINSGTWCFCWNWEPQYGKYGGKLISRSLPVAEQKKSAQKLLDLIGAAYAPYKKNGSRMVKQRLDNDLRLLKMYLLSFGFEPGGHLKPFTIVKSWRETTGDEE